MKRLFFVLPLLVCVVFKLTAANATLPFGPGFKNGSVAATTVHTDTVYVNGEILVGTGGTQSVGATAKDISDSIAAHPAGMQGSSFADSLKQRHAKVYADTIRGSVLDMTPQMVDIPIYPDSVSTALDSLTVMLMADITLNTEYSHYLHAFGNGSAAADSLRLVRSFRPLIADPDSAYWWVKSNAANADSAGYSIIVRGKNAAGVLDSVVCTTVLAASAVNTWKRVAIDAGWFEYTWYDLILRLRLTYGSAINVSPVFFK